MFVYVETPTYMRSLEMLAEWKEILIVSCMSYAGIL